MSKITPFLWFEKDADEAAAFYVSVFEDAEITGGMPGLTVSLRLFEQDVVLLNGGPQFPQTEAFSFVIDCESQDEVDYYWDALTADGGEESMCGWLKDKYGVSWQVTPRRLLELVQDPDPARAQRAQAAMMKMQKIVISDLEAAADAA
ncbi:MAG TPA: VOC family protein [Thermomicrobiales bacterium]|nr:VOC family protein [Thermomicrobiales bacterium]